MYTYNTHQKPTLSVRVFVFWEKLHVLVGFQSGDGDVDDPEHDEDGSGCDLGAARAAELAADTAVSPQQHQPQRQRGLAAEQRHRERQIAGVDLEYAVGRPVVDGGDSPCDADAQKTLTPLLPVTLPMEASA